MGETIIRIWMILMTSIVGFEISYFIGVFIHWLVDNRKEIYNKIKYKIIK